MTACGLCAGITSQWTFAQKNIIASILLKYLKPGTNDRSWEDHILPGFYKCDLPLRWYCAKEGDTVQKKAIRCTRRISTFGDNNSSRWIFSWQILVKITIIPNHLLLLIFLNQLLHLIFLNQLLLLIFLNQLLDPLLLAHLQKEYASRDIYCGNVHSPQFDKLIWIDTCSKIGSHKICTL